MNLFFILKYFLLTYPHGLSCPMDRLLFASQQLLSLHFQLDHSHRNNYSLEEPGSSKTSCTQEKPRRIISGFPHSCQRGQIMQTTSARELISHTVNFAQWGQETKTHQFYKFPLLFCQGSTSTRFLYGSCLRITCKGVPNLLDLIPNGLNWS